MLRTPSSKRKKRSIPKLNLTSIMDAVFIFIFFLLFSISFIKIFEIPSDVPTATNEPPKNEEKPLALTVKIEENGAAVYQGVPSKFIKLFSKTPEGKYDFQGLHDYLITLKKEHLKEETVVLEPIIDVDYETIIKFMDTVRILRNTDESLYRQGKDGLNEKVETLFGNIVFGNLLS